MTDLAIEFKPPAGRQRKWRVLIGGTPDVLDPSSGDERRRIARRYGVDEAAMLDAYEAARAKLQAAAEQATAPPARDTSARGWSADGSVRRDYDTLAEALQDREIDYADWADRDAIACVDVDLSDEAKALGRGWTEDDVRALLRQPVPLPRWAWLSKSGGLHAVFYPDASGALTGAERAGLWCLESRHVTQAPRVVAVEDVAVTATVPQGRLLHSCARDYGAADMRGALLRRGGVESASEEQVQQWLAQRGLSMGGRYGAEHCPFPHSRGRRDPVEISERGVRCFSCQRSVSWSALVGGATSSEAARPVAVDMAQHLTHWTHARYVLEAEYPALVGTGGRFLRLGYQALIKLLHARDDPAETQDLLRRVFDLELRQLRSSGAWIRDGDYAGFALRPPSVAALPWSHGHPVRIDLGLSDAPLPGYPSVEPVAHLVERPAWRGDAVLVPMPIAGVSADDAGSLDYEDARDVLRRALPGVPDAWLDALLLLVVAGLRAQLGLPEPPLLICHMPSGSGKGALVAAASGVLGVPARQISLDGDPEEAGRSIGMALEHRAPIVWCDEVGKLAGFFRRSSALLKLARVYHWRRLHTGWVDTPVRSAVLLAGSTLPPGLLMMQELDRRAACVSWDPIPAHVTGRWAGRAPEVLGRAVAGLQDLRQSPTGAAIADAYVREALSRLEGERLPSWPVQAESLGATRIRDGDDMRELRGLALALYDLWCGEDPDVIWDGPRPCSGWLRGWRTGRGDAVAELLAGWVDEDAPRAERYARVKGPLDTLPLGDRLSVRVYDRGSRVWIRFVADADPHSLERHDRSLFPYPLEAG